MNRSSLILSRRSLLSLGAGFGLTYLAAPALAAASGAERKLVVIVCRGAMDGLSVSPPIGDRNYAGLRGAIAISADQALKLDGDFGLHPKLATIYGLAQTGQARIVPAAAIPQRIRSHFEAQDLLESGGEQLYGATTGWLNRALTAMTPDRRVTAISIGAQKPLVLRGPAPTPWTTTRWPGWPGRSAGASADRRGPGACREYAHCPGRSHHHRFPSRRRRPRPAGSRTDAGRRAG